MTNAELQAISLPRLARLLVLGVLGMAGLLALGIGAVDRAQSYVLPTATANETTGVGLIGR